MSAPQPGLPTHHCIGHAISSTPEGPYHPLSDTPLICPLSQGGAIDPSGFRDVDGQRYLLYKIDGNTLGHGGSCGNTNAPVVPTPIMLQPVAADGFTFTGPATQILDRDASDGPLVEAPSLARRPGGGYYLYFSSNCWNNPGYNVNRATASSITGPYTKTGPLLVTGDSGLVSPGGADVSGDGTVVLFHANFPNGRTMFAADIGSAAGGTGVTFLK
jgi:beta-xylosidase